MTPSYGVRRLVLLNSGNYLAAEIELDRPVHLAADNNRGKSTLVNSLQFLYISDEKKMRFGKRSLEDSRKHYFGNSRSYIVYECQTPTGPQCMIVRGRGSMTGNRYERFIVEGPYREADFTDGEKNLLEFDDIRGRFADRNLVQVKPSELWSVLAAGCPTSSGPSAARLGLLPIKKRDQYLAFCDVFVRLLSLQDTDARTLRQLVIESHSGDIQERRIDIPSEYRDEFARAERAEHELAFVRQASPSIRRGLELRGQLAGMRADIESHAPVVMLEASRSQASFVALDLELTHQQTRLANQLELAETERDEAIKSGGGTEQVLAGKQQQWKEIQAQHEQWQSYSPEFIEQMREQAASLNREIARREGELNDAEKFNLDAMIRSVASLEQKIARDEGFASNAERTLLAALQRNGVSRKEVENVFQIANAELLKLIVDDGIELRDVKSLAEQIKAIAGRISGDVYQDDRVKIELSNVTPVSQDLLFDLAALHEQMRLDRQQFETETSRLKAAQDQEAAKKRLSETRAKLEQKNVELRDYDDYSTAWSRRDVLQAAIEAAQSEFDQAEAMITQAKAAVEALKKCSHELSSRLESLHKQKSTLQDAIDGFNEQLGLNRFRLPSAAQEDPLSGSKDIDVLIKASPEIARRLDDLIKSLKSRQPMVQKLTGLESKITASARQTESEPRYFNNPDQEWDGLAEEVEASEQMEAAAKNAWDHLFKTLGARMRGLVDGIERIKRTVERLQRGLKSYQVSNLESVEITVEEVSDAYRSIEALASADSLFNDPEQIELGKKRLRRMIDSAQVIELESLFELQIRIQETNGEWRRAGSLDEIGSTGTGMTVKAMIFIQLIRAIASDNRYRMFFYIDGVGELDDRNLSATAALAVSQGILPITADPRLHLEPLAHPHVTVYSLGQHSAESLRGRFYIDSTRTYHAEKSESHPAEDQAGAR